MLVNMKAKTTTQLHPQFWYYPSFLLPSPSEDSHSKKNL